MRKSIKNQAFTLVEIMIAVGMVILLSALSIHSLLRAKISANESAAIKNLRTLQTAFASYRIVNPAYPQSLNTLGSENPPYVDSTLTQGAKQGYRFSIEQVDANTFRLVAVPQTSGVTGIRSFFIDQGGEITTALAGGAAGIGIIPRPVPVEIAPVVPIARRRAAAQ